MSEYLTKKVPLIFWTAKKVLAHWIALPLALLLPQRSPPLDGICAV